MRLVGVAKIGWDCKDLAGWLRLVGIAEEV